MSESPAKPTPEIVTGIAARAASALGNPFAVMAAYVHQLVNDAALPGAARDAGQNIRIALDEAIAAQRELSVLGGTYRIQLETVDLAVVLEPMALSAEGQATSSPQIRFDRSASPFWVSADIKLLAQACALIAQRHMSSARSTCRISLDTTTDSAAEARSPSAQLARIRFIGEGALHPIPRTDDIAELFCAAVAGLHHGTFAGGTGPTASTLVLPLVAAPTPRPTAAVVDHGTILLIDDDAPFREATKLALQAAGFRILQAGTATQALEMWQWYAPRIRLLVTDVALDGAISGVDVARRVLADRPNTPILFASGADATIVENAGLVGTVNFVQKPFTPNQLLAAIHGLLGAAPTRTL